MSVLSRREIQTRLTKGPDEEEGLVITPLLCGEEPFDADSVDLRLGCYFLLPKVLRTPFFCPDQKSATCLHDKVHVPLGRYLVVPAHQTILGATLEFIKLPYDVSGEILTKSSVARTFIVVETAPWIHPRYRGCLTLEIANVSNTPVLLYPGRLIGQLILLNVNCEPTDPPKLSPKYFGPVYPEGPKFEDPAVDLRKIGVRSTRILDERTVDSALGAAQRVPPEHRQKP